VERPTGQGGKAQGTADGGGNAGGSGPVSQQKAGPLLDLEDLESRPLAASLGINLAGEFRRLANLR
jgi:hypothetical protein